MDDRSDDGNRHAVLGRDGEHAQLIDQAELLADLGFWESTGGPGTNLGRWSAGTYRIFGIVPETPVGADTLARMVHPDDRERVLAGRTRMLAGEQPSVSVTHRIVRPDGEVRWVATRAAAIRDPSGRPVKVVGVVQDITDRRAAERTRAMLAAIVEQSGDAILAVDLAGHVLTWNPGAERLFGYTAREMLGASTERLLPPERRTEFATLLGRFRDQDVDRDLEFSLVRADGRPIDVAVTVMRLRSEAGAVSGLSVTVRDLREKKEAEAELRRTEEQLRATQKLEAIGSLAGGVAHDFNNLLTVILSLCAVLDRRVQDDATRADVREIEAAAERAAALTRQLLAFGRRQVLRPRVLHLGLVVAELEPMLRRVLGEDVVLVVLVAPDLPPVLADAGQLDQVLMNLVVNARDAMPGGGTLTIEARRFRADESTEATHPEVPPGRYALLSVTDTGVGMDADTRARVFEPFFSTKGDRGTGLGLATVFGIVKQSGGWISVRSEPSKGTTFELLLPVASRVSHDTGDRLARPKAAIGPGVGTILLCEDEAPVRAVVGDALRRAGYVVLEAASPGDALLLSEQHEGVVDLLLTDVVMPRLGGRKLAERIQATRPTTRVLYMSGYTDDAVVRDGAQDGAGFLQKPITPDSLLAKVREVLSA